jgi:hypothetical protein
MEVTTGSQSQAVAQVRGQQLPGSTNTAVIENVVGAGVGRCNDMRNAIGDGVFGHGQGIFESFRAVIKTRQNVAVEVDHVLSVCGIFAGQEKTLCSGAVTKMVLLAVKTSVNFRHAVAPLRGRVGKLL